MADMSTFFKFGEMLGQLNNLPAESGAIAREAGSLHHYSKLEGLPRNDLDAAVSWLTQIGGSNASKEPRSPRTIA